MARSERQRGLVRCSRWSPRSMDFFQTLRLAVGWYGECLTQPLYSSDFWRARLIWKEFLWESARGERPGASMGCGGNWYPVSLKRETYPPIMQYIALWRCKGQTHRNVGTQSQGPNRKTKYEIRNTNQSNSSFVIRPSSFARS